MRSISRRQFSTMLFSAAGLPLLDWHGIDELFLSGPGEAGQSLAFAYPLYDEAVAHVVPPNGFQSKIAFKDALLTLVEGGAIDRGKFFRLYGNKGARPGEFANFLTEPSDDPILLTSLNAVDYVNLLWPIGLTNYMATNAESPIVGDSLYNFASTAGWTLARELNGGTYFNQLPVVDLTKEEEERVVQIAKSTYRPCCNNSTFFQDCNHGSALLGLLELGASQGLTDDELYAHALAFNSFWFPDYYIRTALFFKVIKKTEWSDVDPRVILGRDYSAGGPWQQNVAARVEKIPGLIPPAPGAGAGCGV